MAREKVLHFPFNYTIKEGQNKPNWFCIPSMLSENTKDSSSVIEQKKIGRSTLYAVFLVRLVVSFIYSSRQEYYFWISNLSLTLLSWNHFNTVYQPSFVQVRSQKLPIMSDFFRNFPFLTIIKSQFYLQFWNIVLRSPPPPPHTFLLVRLKMQF